MELHGGRRGVFGQQLCVLRDLCVLRGLFLPLFLAIFAGANKRFEAPWREVRRSTTRPIMHA